jgi:hypothetical protein
MDRTIREWRSTVSTWGTTILPTRHRYMDSIIKEWRSTVSTWGTAPSYTTPPSSQTRHRYMDRIIREAIEIEFYPNNMVGGFCLSKS